MNVCFPSHLHENTGSALESTMAHVSNVDDVVSSRSLTTTSVGTLTSPPPPLPNLPFDLVADNILCRLPVKLLLQLKCVCKSWKSLISDPKFAKKHLRLSTKLHRYHIMVSSMNNSQDLLLFDSLISSVFSTSNSVSQTQLSYPITRKFPIKMSISDGILCFATDTNAVLWNPSLRKLKELPPFDDPLKRIYFSSYSFGYDHFIDNYKTIGISFCIDKNEVSVHTMGTDYWRRIEDFPCYGSSYIHGTGTFVSGTVNWLVDNHSNNYAIVSLDLEKESYQYLPHPYHNVEKNFWSLEVVKDCLCIFANMNMFMDVWIMKEYGKKESWTKLYNVPYMEDRGFCAYCKALYISEDDQLLLGFYEVGTSILGSSCTLKLVVYDSKNGTLKIPNIQNTSRQMDPTVYLESLISPCS